MPFQRRRGDFPFDLEAARDPGRNFAGREGSTLLSLSAGLRNGRDPQCLPILSGAVAPATRILKRNLFLAVGLPPETGAAAAVLLPGRGGACVVVQKKGTDLIRPAEREKEEEEGFGPSQPQKAAYN